MTPAPAVGTTDYQWPTDTEFVYTRVFDAPAKLVYDAWTKPEHMVNWLGFEGDTMKVPVMDVRPGGDFRWEFYRGDSDELQVVIYGTYSEVREAEFIANTEIMEFGGMTTPSTDCTLTFSSQDGKTKVIGTVVYPDAESAKGARESGMTTGMDVGFDRLDALFASRES